MKTINNITIKELNSMANDMFGELVKAVVDIKQGKIALDAEMHADLEQRMIEDGSNQQDLWGINLYPQKYGTDSFIEFDSMINIRPQQNNRSRGVEDEATRKIIVDIVNKKILK